MSDRYDGPVHAFFGLSYAHYLAVPRSLLESMPLVWQQQFIDLMNQMLEKPAGKVFAEHHYLVQRTDPDVDEQIREARDANHARDFEGENGGEDEQSAEVPAPKVIEDPFFNYRYPDKRIPWPLTLIPAPIRDYPKLHKAMVAVCQDAGIPCGSFSLAKTAEELKQWDTMLASLSDEQFEKFTVGERTEQEAVVAARPEWCELHDFLDSFFDGNWSERQIAIPPPAPAIKLSPLFRIRNTCTGQFVHRQFADGYKETDLVEFAGTWKEEAIPDLLRKLGDGYESVPLDGSRAVKFMALEEFHSDG